MDKSTHQVRCEHWLKLINNCLSSGMKKNEWCKVHGVSEKAFYYWQRILRNEAYIDSVVPKQTSLISLETPQEVSFVELKEPSFSKISESGFHPAVIIHYDSMSLEISNDVTPELLKLLGGLMNAK